MPEFYGYTEVNEVQIEIVPGAAVMGTSGDDVFTASTYALIYYRLPLVRLYGLEGNDTFYGDGVTCHGGTGDDLFLSGGTETYLVPTYGANRLFGDAGNDRCYDHVGSTDFYGGAGSDLFSTGQPTFALNHSYPGDVDRAFLGGGADVAEVRVSAQYQNRDDFLTIEERQIIVDGGLGRDLLILTGLVVDGRDPLHADGRINLAHAVTGTLAMNNFEASGFEAVRAEFRIFVPTWIAGTSGSDVIAFNSETPIYWDEVTEFVPNRVVVNGGLGNDTIFGSPTFSVDRLIGGDGNDFIVTRGTTESSSYDWAYGGTGNDILTSDWVDAAADRAHLFGGDGRDIFVVSLSRSGDRIIEDFVRGEDRIVVAESSWVVRDYATERSGLLSAIHRVGAAQIMIDTVDELQFSFSAHDVYDQERDLFVRYDRVTGELAFDDWVSGMPGAYFYDWKHLATFTGAPDLTLADFGYLLT